MKSFSAFVIAVLGFALLPALGWLAGGCASSSRDSSAPKPGSGIAEYRAVASDAHRAVDATVKSLEALARPTTRASSPHPALPGFDRALHELELTSIKARSRAEAIMARGQTYFDEWKGSLLGMTNATAARAETERYSQLHEHFERVRQRSGEIREEFRPFMSKLREFRARLDKPANAAGSESSRQELDRLMVSGRRVLQTLESISTALNEAEGAVRATLASKR